IQVIEEGVKGTNVEDFQTEFEAYWRQQDGIEEIYSFISESNDDVRELNLWVFFHEKRTTTIAAEPKFNMPDLARSFFHMDMKSAYRSRCIYLPLKKETQLIPSTLDLSEIKNLRGNILSNLSPSNQERLRKIFKRKQRLVPFQEFIIIGLPLSNGRLALFGIRFWIREVTHMKNRKNKVIPTIRLHPLVMSPATMTAHPLSVKRFHPQFQLNRTGGNAELINKHAVVIGVGSIGSEVATGLAKLGLAKLTFVDPDVLDINNIHRHFLGVNHLYVASENGPLNRFKVFAMKDELQKKYPMLEVDSICKEFTEVVNQDLINWSEVDLVVVAIGSPNEEMYINRFMHQLEIPIPVIYTWVEPIGIGGHALVTLNGTKQGCYQCLFMPVGEEPISNRAAFAKPFQTFAKSITGCGSAFTPYNFLDSQKTALLAVEESARVLLNKETDNPLCSWKGDANDFLAVGFELNPRYSFTHERLHEMRLLYKDPQCPICSGGKQA
ncbi:hypothetical protein BEP19_16680, partial [Ammoniphilus oxalaticus]